MEYNNFKYSYRPKNVSFEVGAILLEEEKNIELGALSLQSTMIGKYNYKKDGYAIEMSLGFNNLTNQQHKKNQAKHKNEAISAYERRDKSEKKEKSLIKHNSVIKQVLYQVQAIAEVILENMLLKYNLLFSSGKIKKHHKANLSFLDVKRVNELLKAETTVNTHARNTEVKAKYTLHPHVDALLKERERNHNRGRYR